MPHTGALRTWHDDRGFGFIAPTGGGRELFVHVSAFPRDGTVPTVGESLTYELGRGKDGRPQAVRVRRKALGPAPSPRAAAKARAGLRFPSLRSLIGIVIVVAMGAQGYTTYRARAKQVAVETPAPPVSRAESTQPVSSPYRCDGRTHCSQMTSCKEARYFLENCPGTEMDGNHDGTPCEKQWCTGPLAR